MMCCCTNSYVPGYCSTLRETRVSCNYTSSKFRWSQPLRRAAGHRAPRSRAPLRSTATLAQRWQSTAQWYMVEAEKPAFAVMEFVLGLGFLALIDGGFSGDWLKYDLIDEATQKLLTAMAYAGVIVHSGIGAAGAIQAVRLSPNAPIPIAAIAFLRGFLCGTPELLLILARNTVQTDSK